MSIRIDALDPTVTENRGHEVPAMREGITVKLTLAQILGLIQKGDLPADVVASLDLADSAIQPTEAASAGQCRLALDGANLRLSRFNGRLLTINGVAQEIPSGGVALAATGLTPATLYYIYAFMSSGTMTLEASTTGRATHTDGTQIKAGDATRALVGMARPITGPDWVDSAAQRFVLSWFNRRAIGVTAQLSADRTVTAAPFTEVNSEIRNEFLAWSDSPVSCSASGSWVVTGASTGAARVSFDGSTGGLARCNTSTATTSGLSLVEAPTLLSEGYHFTTLQGGRTGGTNVIFVGSLNGNVSLVTLIQG